MTMERKTQKRRFQLFSRKVAGKPYFEIRENGAVVFHTSYMSVILLWLERNVGEDALKTSRTAMTLKTKVAA